MSNTKQAKPKRLLSLFLALTMVLCLLPALGTTALAASGSGTEGDPYVVTDYDELRELLRSKTESDPTCYIKLGGDITDSSSRNNHKLSIHDGADIVLDLAGHSLTRSGSTTDYCLFAVCGASLTVNDSVGGGGITARTVAGGPYLTGAAIWVQNWSKSRLTVNGGTFAGGEYGIVTEGGTTVINGGTILSLNPEINSFVQSIAGYFRIGTVIVNGGTFGDSTSAGDAIDIRDAADVTLNNCTAYCAMYSEDRSWPSIKTGTTVTLNGTVSTPKGNYYSDRHVGDKFVISTQIITSMGADVTGFELLNSYFEVEATPLDSTKYTIRDITWSDCHLTDDSPIITDSSMFEAGETWQLKLWFKPAYGYAISNPATLPVTIAGQTATYVGTDGDYYGYKIEKTFSKYLHDYINLSMDAPTAGMTPAEYAETIKIKNNDRFPYNNFEIGEVQCYRADWNDFSTFAAGTTYFITVEIDLKDDTSFEFAHHDSDITALVNGTPVEDYVVVDSDSTWKSNFYTYNGVQLNYQVYFTAKGEPAGVTVSGTATSFNSDTDDVTIQLIKSGEPEASYETVVKGKIAEYSIAGVAAGTYTLQVMKENHVTREYEITVEGGDVELDVKIHLKGDINGDGVINIKDKRLIYYHMNDSANKLTEYAFDVGDVNGDGVINIKDKKLIYNHMSGTSLWS